ncbi:enoyl-CoA hydratase [Mangrovimicrobium sediminis]|uniref:Enoyl-CoA hydratase n=1 Tax=Mangrovimicrobium sediminis TaxID=2562682 RepID=A0A4Z0LYS1_9GAMM|nr:MaoC/PaaZ C-terminal domain-containing protein [Haliea sp. SAOS-164]TGD72523.1 enoyl-CoA hydratase [Haliea sp. SAOS-164]
MSKYDHLIDQEMVNGHWSWDSDRALLYAVGVGAGLDDPLEELQFTTENTPGLPQQVIPSFATIMGLQSDWMELLGWQKVGLSPVGMVHGEQSVTLARPLPVSGTAHLSTILRQVYDKGSGALVVQETRITLADTNEYLGSTCSGIFAQGKGNFGGPRGPSGATGWDQPSRAPDVKITLPVGLNQSLVYRLSGDRHPHGTEPTRARADGFEKPILYGLGTYGFACRALLRGLCEGDVTRFGHMAGRFSKPVYPGDRLDTVIWRTEEGAVFQMIANGERVVLDRGVFRFRE